MLQTFVIINWTGKVEIKPAKKVAQIPPQVTQNKKKTQIIKLKTLKHDFEAISCINHTYISHRQAHSQILVNITLNNQTKPTLATQIFTKCFFFQTHSSFKKEQHKCQL